VSDIPGDLKFLSSHEWARINDDGTVTIGISDHAQSQLGDIVYVELPEVGKEVEFEGDTAIVESVKAASDVYSPISGEIVETNDAIEQEPEIVNQSPFEEGWFFKIRPHNIEEFSELLSPEEYSEICDD
tara:strand:+ start:934 stop:1320 length:387 start_codon:yes stop_codon:yes gene_type:complete